MTHKDAPPETLSQIACREWWTNRQPHVTRAWGRDKHGKFLAEESRLLHEAWEAASRSRFGRAPSTTITLQSAPPDGACGEMCLHCDTPLPSGCGGVFADQAECARRTPKPKCDEG